MTWYKIEKFAYAKCRKRSCYADSDYMYLRRRMDGIYISLPYCAKCADEYAKRARLELPSRIKGIPVRRFK